MAAWGQVHAGAGFVGGVCGRGAAWGGLENSWGRAFLDGGGWGHGDSQVGDVRPTSGDPVTRGRPDPGRARREARPSPIPPSPPPSSIHTISRN